MTNTCQLLISSKPPVFILINMTPCIAGTQSTSRAWARHVSFQSLSRHPSQWSQWYNCSRYPRSAWAITSSAPFSLLQEQVSCFIMSRFWACKMSAHSCSATARNLEQVITCKNQDCVYSVNFRCFWSLRQSTSICSTFRQVNLTEKCTQSSWCGGYPHNRTWYSPCGYCQLGRWYHHSARDRWHS